MFNYQSSLLKILQMPQFTAPNTLTINWHGIAVSIIQLYKINTIASGNKIFKLLPYLYTANEQTQLVAFGGPHSNFLHALAFMGNQLGLHTAALVNSHLPLQSLPTLQQCQNWGMEIIVNSNKQKLQEIAKARELSGATIIPLGGLTQASIEASGLIANYCNGHLPIYLAGGTGCTALGLVSNSAVTVHLLDPFTNSATLLQSLQPFNLQPGFNKIKIIPQGIPLKYGKTNTTLIDFMNKFYQKFNIPTDVVYTAKLFYTIEQLILTKKINQPIQVLHTGGLQGNHSIQNQLVF
jgi:1-aminocyclopropane-1-carboxylate deaminase